MHSYRGSSWATTIHATVVSMVLSCSMISVSAEKGGSAGDLLSVLLPDAGRVADLQEMVRHLGAETYRIRANASKELLDAPVIPKVVMKEALASRNPEIRERMKGIMKDGAYKNSGRMFAKALRTVCDSKEKGLLRRLEAVIESGVFLEDLSLATRAARLTVQQEDLPLVEQMARHADPQRRAIAVAAAAGIGAPALTVLGSLGRDEDPGVRLEAAVEMGNLKNRRGLRILEGFLLSDDASKRVRATQSLRTLTGREFGYEPLADLDSRKDPAQRWKRFLDSPFEITGEVKTDPLVYLFNGIDLTGWAPFRRGRKMGKGEDSWLVEDGVLICPGEGPGDLRTIGVYENYLLEVSYRAEQPRADSGVGVMMQPGGKRIDGGDYLEVQLLPGRTGDLYRIGDFRAEAGGKRIGFSHRRKVDRPERLNEWHDLRLEVRNGEIKVFLEDVLVNEARGPKGAGRILLREENSRFEFRRIVLRPL